MTRTSGWLATLLLLAAGASAADERDDARTWSVDPDVRVDIEIIAGDIEIEAWQRNEIRVRAQGGGRASIGIEASPDWISIQAPGPRGWLGGAGEVDLRIELPEGSRVRAKSINGSIDVKGVRGSVTAHATNGDIEVEGAPREATLETLSSNIQLKGRAGRVAARSVSGSIQLEGVSEEVEATTMSGRIRVEGDDIERAELRSMAGDIEIEASLAPRARIYAKTFSGQVRLRLPEDTSARFDVETFSGGIHSEFVGRIGGDARGDDWSPHGPGQRIRFVVGEGDARIAIDSFSGGVRIERDDGEARERRAERRERRLERLEERRERRQERAEEQAEREAERAEKQAEREAERAEERAERGR